MASVSASVSCEWACTRCTFINKQDAVECEMCGTLEPTGGGGSLAKEDLEFPPKIHELVYSKRKTADKRWFVARVVAIATYKGAVIVEFRNVSGLFVLIAHRG